MLYLHVWLFRSRLCHALCPPWVCIVVLWGHLLVWLHLSLLWFVWMWPLMRYIFVMLVCLIHTFLHFVRCWYACLACFMPSVWLSLLLCVFAHLPTCSYMSVFIVRTPISWSYGHPIQTYICPTRTPPFCMITCLFALRLALSLVVSFSIFSP